MPKSESRFERNQLIRKQYYDEKKKTVSKVGSANERQFQGLFFVKF